MTDRLYLPWDGTTEAFRAIQAMVPTALLVDEPAISESPLVVFPGTAITAFIGDVITVDHGAGTVGILELDRVAR